ncbi:uncharacterized protein LOC130798622 isoform X2 [Amaranthus tricolor]|uniref:uncharacterized protein LOC130798622 isoform X2 n=1 Tax=Amaranthus tricolor TaxID=29722 RepID=UPI00258533A3|nr:uncharacterized protein LOC130798622 isoform X2 [Amaranthus tricolor]
MEVSEIARKSNKGIRAERIPLSVYLAKNMENNSGYQVDLIKVDSKSYDSLVTQKDRNKENKAILSKWTTYKRPGSRLGRVTTPTVEVFVDEECEQGRTVL